MRKLLQLIEAFFIIGFSSPLAILPHGLSLKIGEILGLLLYYLWGSRRKIAINNLKTTLSLNAIAISKPAEKIIQEHFRNLGRSFSEVIKIYYGLGKKIVNSVEIEGIENFLSAQSKGRGVLFVTGHCGNWELMAIVMSAKFQGIAVVARSLNNIYLNKFVEKIREYYGNTVIYKKGALKKILKILNNNDCVGILMDQAVLSDEGYVIDFLGRGAWTTKMPALIARKTGSAVLPAFIHRTDKNHKIVIHKEVVLSTNNDREQALKEDTKRFSEYIEEYIKKHPSEWLWIHRRWKRVKQV
ncbi:MAG: lysophospholipid acyltransferase family protein [Nitrospirae bacterium]|nr:lysophospholipid acyltransferase family protein [Nitrospirota bacterium]